jgi:hypothetical protein
MLLQLHGRGGSRERSHFSASSRPYRTASSLVPALTAWQLSVRYAITGMPKDGRLKQIIIPGTRWFTSPRPPQHVQMSSLSCYPAGVRTPGARRALGSQPLQHSQVSCASSGGACGIMPCICALRVAAWVDRRDQRPPPPRSRALLRLLTARHRVSSTRSGCCGNASTTNS